MKKTTHLCVDLKEIAQLNLLKDGQAHAGVLTRRDDCTFLFEEQTRDTVVRNPRVFAGQHLNVSKNGEGRYVVHLRRLELTTSTDPLAIADQIYWELVNAKQMLQR